MTTTPHVKDRETYIKQIKIPVTIFNNEKLTPLETIIKFLKENEQLRFTEISKLIGREQRSVNMMYRAANKKIPQQLPIIKTTTTIPAKQLADERYTVAEHVVKHLKEHYKLTHHQIAVLMRRNDRTIWTLYNRTTKRNK